MFFHMLQKIVPLVVKLLRKECGKRVINELEVINELGGDLEETFMRFSEIKNWRSTMLASYILAVNAPAT